MTDLSQEESRGSIEDILVNDGGFTDARRKARSITKPGSAESIDSLREQLEALIKDFATELNTDTKLGFELVHNPEDNKYETMKIVHPKPSLTFELDPTEVIINSNGESLDQDNVKAIRKVGDSTKKERHEYLGEKGIGFKSVFKVASNLHIQSSPLAYPKDDIGIGILTTFNQQQFRDIPQNLHARMTLELASNAIFERLLEGFSELPNSLRMFLSKITRFTVATQCSSCLVSNIQSHKATRQRGTLTKYSEAAGSPGQEIIQRYRVLKRNLRSLLGAAARPQTKQTDIPLAFPSHCGSTTVIQEQYVSACLYMLQSLFSYLIQSDIFTITKIIFRYTKHSLDPILQSSAMHVRYLCWLLPNGGTNLNEYIFLLDQDLVLLYLEPVTTPWKKVLDDLYVESGDVYGPKQLPAKMIDKDQIVAPGQPALLIKSAYSNTFFANARRSDVSWADWIQRLAHLQHVPCLMRRGRINISDVFLYIIKSRGSRGDKLVGILKIHWSSFVHLMNDDKIRKQLSETCVACESLANTPLRDTYIPIPELEQICKGLGVGGKYPFLKLPIEIGSKPGNGWDFLNTFGVGRKADIRFYLKILQVIVQENKDITAGLSVKTRKSIFTVYEEIEKQSKAADPGEIEKFFTDYAAIYIPTTGSRQASWASPDKCVWKAPGFFDQSFTLASAEGYRENDHLQRLFKGILGIDDTNYNDYLTQLSAQKERPNSLPITSDIYHHLLLDAPDESSWNNIREQFERCSLVYVPFRQKWHPPSSCLWTDNTRISGRFGIATPYNELYELFVRRLGVPWPDLPMLVNELIQVAQNGQCPNLPHVKDLIRDINSLSPTEKALLSLRSCNILPVRGLDDQISLKSTTDTFAIIDHIQYGNLFRAKVPVLDFGLEEIQELRPILSALSLESRYMTRAIKETTEANDSMIDLMLSRQIQEKAFALFRCAVHYGCAKPQDQSLYRRLLAIDVYRSLAITRSITISICGTQATVEGVSANLHTESDVSRIRLYVPQDEEQRELCYLCQIPQIFVSHLSFTEPAASKVIGDLVRATRTTVLTSLLDEHGIVSVPGIEPLPPAAVTEATDASPSRLIDPLPTIKNSIQLPVTPLNRGHRSARYQRSLSSDFRSYRESSAEEDSPAPTTYSFDRDYGTSASSVSPGQLSGPEEAVPEPPVFRDLYFDLLHQVVTAAAQADFPPYSPIAPTSVVDADCDALPDDVFRICSDGQVNYDANIRAAGELYVFEMLRKYNLIGFGRHNWKSTVRHKVCGLERYKDIQPWMGVETAAIVYEDVGPDFMLTKLLESLGYLCAGNGPVTYYLDVKTTKEECGTPFLVNRAQYERMIRMALHTDRPTAEVYIILQVFNLGKANVGVQLYVDPVTMGEEGGLIFKAESCTVVPSPSPSIFANEEL